MTPHPKQESLFARLHAAESKIASLTKRISTLPVRAPLKK